MRPVCDLLHSHAAAQPALSIEMTAIEVWVMGDMASLLTSWCQSVARVQPGAGQPCKDDHSNQDSACIGVDVIGRF